MRPVHTPRSVEHWSDVPRRVLFLVAIMAVLALMLVAVWPVYEASHEPPPLTYRGQPFAVSRPVYRVGETVEISGERCNRFKVPLVFVSTRAFVRSSDGLRIATSPIPLEAVPGCAPFVRAQIPIPDDLEPGRYLVTGVVNVQGRYRAFVVGWRSQEFEVVR